MACSISIIIDHILIVISSITSSNQYTGQRVSVRLHFALCNRELLENGGFIYMPAVKVRARGKAAAGLSAGVKANMMGAAIGKSPAHFGR